MKRMNYSGNWQAYRQAAAEAQKQGKLIIAETTLRRALKEAEEFAQLDEGLINDIHSLAGWHCANRNYEDAERLYKSVLTAREKVFGAYHPDVADSLEKLAVILKENKRNNEAMALGYRALSLKGRVAAS